MEAYISLSHWGLHAELGRQLDELEAENAALRHDVERHINISTELLFADDFTVYHG